MVVTFSFECMLNFSESERVTHNCWHSVQREQPITSHAHASCNSVNWPLRDARPRRTTPAFVDCLQSGSNCYVRRMLWHTDSLAAAMTDNRDNDSIDWHGRITLRTRIANSLTRCHSATCCLHVSSDQSPHNHPNAHSPYIINTRCRKQWAAN